MFNNEVIELRKNYKEKKKYLRNKDYTRRITRMAKHNR